MAKPRLWNLPNLLTVSRIVMTAGLVGAMSVGGAVGFAWALGLFALASVTDFLDGYLARKWGLISNFGKLMDPLADKVLVLAAFLLLSVQGAVPAWITVVLLTRELLVTGLRSLAAERGEVLPADHWGKVKTVVQVVCVLFWLSALAFQGMKEALVWGLGNGLLAVTLLATVGSGFNYLWKSRSLFLERENEGESKGSGT
ncbi:MAG: CDP-diacylglycerol--glycerol-3-phosphate 3-phosphatidyltransferase [Verrucomicrobiota bacterium]